LSLVNALSRYVTTRDGELLVFSIIANNLTTPASEVTRVQDVLDAALAAMEWRRR
jgi:D-alanyl-D-alanine carboxypeptidase